MEYSRRILDTVLDDLLPHLAATAIEGAKGVGKTATARRRAATAFYLDDPAQREALAAHDGLLATSDPPVLIDEWQLLPRVWDSVRREVDRDPSGGRFILTGSAGAADEARIHSGAGRIVSHLMRPLSLAERGLAAPTVSLSGLLRGSQRVLEGASPLDVADYAGEIARSGFPGIRNLPERARNAQLEGYLRRIVEHDLAEAGASVRRPAALRSWLAAYGAATSTDASYTTILDAATASHADKPARQTVAVYREHLQRLFVLDPVPAWEPAMTPLTRLKKTPKHHLVDPALAAHLAGIAPDALIRGAGNRVGHTGGTWLGALFESLAALSVRVYAQAVDARVGHLRTRNADHEVDLIVEDASGRVVAIEVRLGPTVDDRDVRHLHWLRSQLGERLADAVVITTGPYAFRRPDGVGVIPLALLGP